MEKCKCQDGYMKDSLESRLEMSRNIGLYLKNYHSLLCASMLANHCGGNCGGTAPQRNMAGEG